jgi:hypothetical protein
VTLHLDIFLFLVDAKVLPPVQVSQQIQTPWLRLRTGSDYWQGTEGKVNTSKIRKNGNFSCFFTNLVLGDVNNLILPNTK